MTSVAPSFWQDRRVLVTGAGGFIGSHLVEALVASGARVRALVRYTSRGDLGALSEVEATDRDRVDLVHGDLARADIVEAAFGGFGQRTVEATFDDCIDLSAMAQGGRN